MFPTCELLVVEERLRQQQAEGGRVPESMELDEIALRAPLVGKGPWAGVGVIDRLGDEVAVAWGTWVATKVRR